MNVPQTEMNALRALAGKIKRMGSHAMHSAGVVQGQSLEDLMGLTAQLEARLEMAGAERPAVIASPREVPLALLDTPANRKKAAKLRESWEAALEVDQERYGPTIGTDGEAGAIELLLADVEMEIGGPVGLVRE